MVHWISNISTLPDGNEIQAERDERKTTSVAKAKALAENQKESDNKDEI